VIPPTLAVRRAAEDLDERIDRLRTEAEVREYVAELNERIRKAAVGLMGGPPVLLAQRDADRVVRKWRGRRA
jgi:hypothetical protein